MANVSKKKARRKAVMLGVALDSDGHKRLTTGPNFVLAGGSEGSHEVMTETAIKINEQLAASPTWRIRGGWIAQVIANQRSDVLGLHYRTGLVGRFWAGDFGRRLSW